MSRHHNSQRARRNKRNFFVSIFAAAAAVLGGVIIAGDLVGGASNLAAESEAKKITLYKNPQCSCCEGYASYLRTNGYTVLVKATHNLSLIKNQYGVPKDIEGCHTSIVDGYVVEGHVPVATLNRLLAERPDIKGISLPGMPQGSPGMTGVKSEPFKIFEISNGATKHDPKIYALE